MTRRQKRSIGLVHAMTAIALNGWLFLASPAAALHAADCSSQSKAECPIRVGSSHFTFSNWDGPQITVWTHIPANVDAASAPILFVLHGAKRDPARYRDDWIGEAAKAGFIIVAPEFSREAFPGSRNYNLGAIFAKGSQEPRDESKWTFSAIEPVFDEVVARLGSSQKRYTLYGHSAGSQFVHRFLFFTPEARVKRYLIANAGWYTFADPAIDFPFGLGGSPVKDGALRAALAKDVVVLLGDQDSDANHSSLNRSKGAMRQGPHRFARGKAFYAAAQTYAQKRGWEFGWSLRVIEGVAHSNGGIASGAFDLVE